MDTTEEIRESLLKLNLEKLETVELFKLQEVLNQLFADEADYWYNYMADGEKLEGRAHYICALLLCKYIEDIHKILLSRAI